MTTTVLQSPTSAPDFAAVKTKQQATWASGDYSVIGATLQIVAENLCEAIELRAGERVLDVAAGTGNAAIAAARRWCEVVATDYVPALLERGRERAAAEHLAVEFREGDVERLPLPDASFDVVLSTFGVMFAPDQSKAASELLRVCRPGGRIGLANWTPEGFIGQLFKTVGKHVAPPAGIKPPPLWGTEERLREIFGDQIAALKATRKHFVFRYRSAEHCVQTFRTYYGPTLKAFAAAGEKQAALEADLTALAQQFNKGAGTFAAPSEYLEVVISKR